MSELSRYDQQQSSSDFREEIRSHPGKGRDRSGSPMEFPDRVGGRDSEDLHARAERRLDSDMGILDDEAVRGCQPEPPGGNEEDIRRRFAVRHIVGGNHRREKFVETRDGKDRIQIRARS